MSGKRYDEYFLLLWKIIFKIVDLKVDNNVFWNTQNAPDCTIFINKNQDPPCTNLNPHPYWVIYAPGM